MFNSERMAMHPKPTRSAVDCARNLREYQRASDDAGEFKKHEAQGADLAIKPLGIAKEGTRNRISTQLNLGHNIKLDSHRVNRGQLLRLKVPSSSRYKPEESP